MKEKDDSVKIDIWDGWKRLKFACDVTGLKRSWFYPKIREGKIRSAVLMDEGRTRGIRMINMPSLKAYIERNLIEDGQGSERTEV
jgi:hypothetical protein